MTKKSCNFYEQTSNESKLEQPTHSIQVIQNPSPTNSSKVIYLKKP